VLEIMLQTQYRVPASLSGASGISLRIATIWELLDSPDVDKIVAVRSLRIPRDSTGFNNMAASH
jgi:hypothetical protein